MPKENEAEILKNDMPALDMQARVMPESYNESENTIEVDYTAGERVKRWGYFGGSYGYYLEELSTEVGHVRLERLKAGKVPALDSHSSHSLDNILGRCIDGDETKATVKFSSRDSAKERVEDIKEGIVNNISVGYRVYKYEDISTDEDEIRVLRAIDWEPLEVSFVAVPADGGAGVRSEKETNQCVVIDARAKPNLKEEKKTMPQENKKGEGVEENNTSARSDQNQTATPPAAAPEKEARAADPVADDSQTHVDAGRVQERARISEIKTIVRKANLAQDFADKLIEDDKTVDQARAEVLNELAKADEDKAINSNIRVATPEGQLTRREAMENFLLYRADPSRNKLNEQSRDFVGNSLLDLARECLIEQDGFKSVRGVNKMELVKRALHTTSDFPELLANTANKSLRMGYENTRKTFMPFSRQITLPDFKEMSRVALSNASSLVEVVEDGEYKRGTFGEGAEKISLSTFGRIIGITRQMIINDDLDSLTRIPQKLAATAARLENRQVYSILTDNPVLNDGVALFDAAHGNLTDALLGVDGLGVLRALMRVQRDPSGNDVLNIEPRFLVVPAALETAAAKLQAQVIADSSENVNPFSGSFGLIVDGQLDASSPTNYFMIADPAEVDTIEYAYLEGQEGPYIESRDCFNRDGLEIKVRHDFAAIAVDHRGIAKSTNDAA